jgi:hypothetical protein
MQKVVFAAARRGVVVARAPWAPAAAPALTGLRVRAFGGHATHGGDEPFLDPKVVTERILTVVKNFEKVQAAKVTATAKTTTVRPNCMMLFLHKINARSVVG